MSHFFRCVPPAKRRSSAHEAVSVGKERSQRSVPKRLIGQVGTENVRLCLPAWAICRHALRIGFDEQSSLRGAYEGRAAAMDALFIVDEYFKRCP